MTNQGREGRAMRRFQLSMVQLIVVAAVLAFDFAVVRSLLRVTPGSNQIAYFVMIDPTHSITALALAIGVLPMGTLLVPATVAELFAIRRGEVARSGRSGFVACGWLLVAAYVTIAALSPPAIGRYIGAVGELLGPILTPPLNALFGPNLDRLEAWPLGGTILIEALEATPALVGLFVPEMILTWIGVRWLRRPVRDRKRTPEAAGYPPSVDAAPDDSDAELLPAASFRVRQLSG